MDATTLAKARKAMEGSGFTLADDGTVVSAQTGLPLGSLFQQHLQTGQVSSNIEDQRSQSAQDKLIDAGQAFASGYREGNASGFATKPPRDVIDTMIAEAGGNEAGLRAVAAVINNRSGQWGLTPLQVVQQQGQFEGYSNPGHASKAAQKDASVRAKAERAWNDITSGRVPDPTGGGVSFRASYASRGMSAPHGTVTIGGNTFAKGQGSPQTALAAINAVAPPLPQQRPSALAYAPAASVPSQPRAPMQLPSDAMYGVGRLSPGQKAVLPTDFATDTGPAAPSLMSLLAPKVAATPSPALTSRSVHTVAIDPMTGNPVSASQPQQRDLQTAINDYAARLGASRTTGGFKTANPQAGNVPLPAGVVPASAQRDMNAADAILKASTPTIGSAFNGGWGSSAFLPTVPGASGTLVAGKDMSRLPSGLTSEMGYGPPVAVPPSLAAINTAVPLPRARPVVPLPVAYTAPVAPPMPRPRPTIAPPQQHGLGGLLGLLLGGGGGSTAPAPLPQAPAPAPATVLSPTVHAALMAQQTDPRQQPGQAPGTAFLQAQGQNTSGMTDGQVADALKKSMGMY